MWPAELCALRRSNPPEVKAMGMEFETDSNNNGTGTQEWCELSFFDGSG